MLDSSFVSTRFLALYNVNAKDVNVTNAHTYYKRYTMEYIPIQYKTDPDYIESDSVAPNEKYANAFEKEIVDTRVNYCLSNPMDIRMEEGSDDEFRNRLKKFMKESNYNNFISNSSKLTGACGYSGVLAYIKNIEEYKVGDTTYTIGEKAPFVDVRLKTLFPWEYYVHRTEDDTESIEAIRYYSLNYVDENGKQTRKYFGEYYDNKFVYYLESDSEGGSYQQVGEPQAHKCGCVPIIQIKNNELCKPSFYEVIDLMDAYNNITSDYGNEIQSFRHAYMLLKGYKADNDTLDLMRQMRALSVDDEGDVRFITKDIQTQAFELLLNILQKNIERFSGHVNFSDSDVYGRATNLAIKTRIKPLDSRSRSYALELTKGLNDIFKCIFNVWSSVDSKKYDWRDLEYTFNYDTPINDLEHAELLLMLKQLGLSDLDVFGLSPLIPDELGAIERKKKQADIEFGAFNTMLEEDLTPEVKVDGKNRDKRLPEG